MGGNFFIFYVVTHLYLLLKKFFLLIDPALLSEINELWMFRFTSGFLDYSMSSFVFMSVAQFGFLQLCSRFCTWELWLPHLSLSFKILLCLFGVFWPHESTWIWRTLDSLVKLSNLLMWSTFSFIQFLKISFSNVFKISIIQIFYSFVKFILEYFFLCRLFIVAVWECRTLCVS